MPEQRNLILAIVLSVTIIIAFQYFYELPRIQEAQEQQAIRTEQAVQEGESAMPGSPSGAPSPPGVAAPSGPSVSATPSEIIEGTDRVDLDNGQIRGSFSLTGGRIDNVILSDYKLTTAPNSPDVALLSPPGTLNPYFAEFGWVASDESVPVPGRDAVWTDRQHRAAPRPAGHAELGQRPGAALRAARRDRRLLHVHGHAAGRERRRFGRHAAPVRPRQPLGNTRDARLLHPPRGADRRAQRHARGDRLRRSARGRNIELSSQGGWLGFTDKYWLAALVPDQASQLTGTFRDNVVDGQNRYQVDYLRAPLTVPAGSSVETTDRLFVGAKVVEQLDRYSEEYGIPLFDRAVDFGWFYFLTKPLFHVLHFFYLWTGNYGVAILLLTLLVKILFYPLANKSYRAMSKMKKLQPEMMRLREQYGDDKMRMNQELMALYKKEGANPLSGCLPIVVQIPVFFALYKVLFVSIEMRHAPFFGWIQDLSAPDPTSIFNLFGLLPFDPPSFLMIGVWPLLMGATMFLQQKLNPQPADPMQARIMMLLPAMFIFLFATFPAGLVIYWTWNNVLSIAQQWWIMRRMGVPV